jgi:hypothetical protein
LAEAEASPAKIGIVAAVALVLVCPPGFGRAGAAVA